MFALRENVSNNDIETLERSQNSIIKSSVCRISPFKGFPVLVIYRFCHVATVLVSWSSWKVHRMYFLLASSMFVSEYSTSGDDRQRFCYFLHDSAATWFTILSFVSFIFAAKFVVKDWFLPSRFQAPTGKCRLFVNLRVSISFPWKITVSILNLWLLCTITDCVIIAVAALLAFAWSGGIINTMLDF